MKTLMSYAFVAVTFAQGNVTSKEQEQQLLEVERNWSNASANRDKARLAEIVADDFIWVPQSGAIVGKDEYVSTTGAPNRSVGGSQTEEVKTRIYGDTAIVVMKRRTRFVVKGASTEIPVRMTDIFIRRNGQWKAVHRQVTRIATESQ